MMSIINSPWVIAIVRGLISGLAVYLITGLIESRRKKKAIRLKIQTANAEVLQALRLLVGNKVTPPLNLVDSLVSCSARRHSVKKEDLLSPRQLADEVITEVVSNPFLSSQHKAESSQFMLQILTTAAKRGDELAIKPPSFEESGRRHISIVLGTTTFTSVLLGILSTSLGTGTLAISKENLGYSLSLIAVAIMVPSFCLWAVNLYWDIQELRKVRLEVNRPATEVDSDTGGLEAK